jgi:hypothetical protein
MATTLETVTSFYKNTLGRDASASETAYWSDASTAERKALRMW